MNKLWTRRARGNKTSNGHSHRGRTHAINNYALCSPYLITIDYFIWHNIICVHADYSLNNCSCYWLFIDLTILTISLSFRFRLQNVCALAASRSGSRSWQNLCNVFPHTVRPKHLLHTKCSKRDTVIFVILVTFDCMFKQVQSFANILT